MTETWFYGILTLAGKATIIPLCGRLFEYVENHYQGDKIVMWQAIVDRLSGFISEQFNSRQRQTLVLGLSGGIDSSLVAALGTIALGPERVQGVIMPARAESVADRDAKLLADHLELQPQVIDLTNQVELLSACLQTDEPLRLGNVMARLRMLVLYDQAAQRCGLVAGTGNKSELLLGYFTRHGDAACDIAPLLDLYKTEVWELARYLGLPEKLITQRPSADLWTGQTDEEELGISYVEADMILRALIEEQRPPDELKKQFAPEKVECVCCRLQHTAFKREAVPSPALRDLIK